MLGRKRDRSDRRSIARNGRWKKKRKRRHWSRYIYDCNVQDRYTQATHAARETLRGKELSNAMRRWGIKIRMFVPKFLPRQALGENLEITMPLLLDRRFPSRPLALSWNLAETSRGCP